MGTCTFLSMVKGLELYVGIAHLTKTRVGNHLSHLGLNCLRMIFVIVVVIIIIGKEHHHQVRHRLRCILFMAKLLNQA